MKNFFLVLFLVFVGFSAHAQSKVSLEDRAKEIHNKLITILAPHKKPAFKVVKSTDYAARYIPAQADSAKIEIEQKVLDLLKGFSETEQNQALAHIIGHELGHFYLDKKKQENRFIASHNEEDTAELEADLFGAVLVYEAGYRDINTAFLDMIYNAYDRKFEIEPRKTQLKNTEQNAKYYANLFRLANYLMVTGEPELAAFCLEYLAKKFPIFEVYNNLGVAWAMSTKNYKGHPFMTELASPLASSLRDSNEGTMVHKDIAITKARSAFLKSKESATNDVYWYNQACWQLLLGNKDSAQINLNKTNSIEPAWQEKRKILQDFINHYNFSSTSPASSVCNSTEQIAVTINFTENLILSIDDKAQISFYFQENKNYLTFGTRRKYPKRKNDTSPNDKFENCLFEMPLEENSSLVTEKGIKIGDTVLTLKEKYATNFCRYESKEGHFLRYSNKEKTQGILFLIVDGKVKNWIRFVKKNTDK